LTGTGNANATVTLTEGSTVLGTTTADASGVWSFTPTGLASGSQTITASETDVAGNVGTASLTFALGSAIQTDTNSFGTTVLTQVGSNYFLDGQSNLGPEVTLNGAALVVGQAGPWTPMGAVQLATGYEMAWALPGTNLYTIWNMDSSGRYVSDTIGPVAGNSTTLESFETTFNQDLNGDGVIGIPHILIKSDTGAYGTTNLTQVGDDYYLYNASGSGPEVTLFGAALVVGQAGQWTPMGAVQTATGYEMAWKLPGTNLYTIWNMDSSGRYISDTVGAVTGNSTTLESFETTFNQDLNGDGVIGIPHILIQSDTGAYGTTNFTQVGDDYYMYNASGSGPELTMNGAAFVVGQAGPWTPIGAVQTAAGYEMAWELSGTNLYTIWNIDSSGRYISDTVGPVTGNSATLESFETIFNQDLNGDGFIGAPSTTIAATGVTVLSLSTLRQDATIAAGASLELAGADTSSVTFQDTTGTLILDHSSTFTGEVIGFTGDGNVSSSDIIDLRDIAFGSASESYSGTATGGTLTVSDTLGDTAQISLVGNYLSSTFTLSSDGKGGTLVIDPPLSPAASPADTSSQTIAAGQTSDSATIASGAVEHDYGTTSNTTVRDGGSQIVEADGVANNTTIESGGNELVCAGGAVNGATINGGALELQNGALTNASTVDFASAGLLKLDGFGAYDMLVAGFTSPADAIDFAGINYASSKMTFVESSDNSRGTLTATDGIHTASITLLGQYTAASFTSASDGASGTQISIPQASEAQQSVLSHPMHA
jgi:autotransporter passenger strand-loop-strand repeat protein